MGINYNIIYLNIYFLFLPMPGTGPDYSEAGLTKQLNTVNAAPGTHFVPPPQRGLSLTTQQKTLSYFYYLADSQYQVCPLLASTRKHTRAAELKLCITDRYVK